MTNTRNAEAAKIFEDWLVLKTNKISEISPPRIEKRAIFVIFMCFVY